MLGLNGATNRLGNAVYDANGSTTRGAGASIGYDAGNRVSSVTSASGGTEWYGYSPENKRVLRADASGNLYLTLYGVRGEKLTEFQIGDTYTSYDAQHQSVTLYTVIARSSRVWFAGRLVRDGASMATPNQIGSNAQTYPYGEEIGAGTANDRVKFATYTRDSFSGLDYADQRWYASTNGRFNTADPYQGSATPTNPSSWNRYAYVVGDPINLIDPTGLECDDAEKGALTDKIRRLIWGDNDYDTNGGNKGLERRVKEQIYGQYGPGTPEWDTHNQIIAEQQNSLRKSLEKWDNDDCDDPPLPYAWRIATRGTVKDDEYQGPPTLLDFLKVVPVLANSLLFHRPSLVLEFLQFMVRDATPEFAVDSTITFF